MKDWKTAAWWPPTLAILLAFACLLIRAPTLDHIALNPDESQYEATAAFLLASEQSRGVRVAHLHS